MVYSLEVGVRSGPVVTPLWTRLVPSSKDVERGKADGARRGLGGEGINTIARGEDCKLEGKAKFPPLLL